MGGGFLFIGLLGIAYCLWEAFQEFREDKEIKKEIDAMFPD